MSCYPARVEVGRAGLGSSGRTQKLARLVESALRSSRKKAPKSIGGLDDLVGGAEDGLCQIINRYVPPKIKKVPFQGSQEASQAHDQAGELVDGKVGKPIMHRSEATHG